MKQLLIRCFYKIRKVCISFFKIIYKSPQEIRAIPWFKIQGDATLRLNYDLNEESIVFDLGGYEGQWTSDIFSKYCCNIYIFEPVPDFAQNIERRFIRNPKISVYNFGLSDETRNESLYISGNGSSIYKQSLNSVEITLEKAIDFFIANNIHHIDLMKINIEGGEYSLLEHLIEIDFIKHINNIQVQFHDFIPNAEQRMMEIHHQLAATHKLSYQFKFVWENWKLNPSLTVSES